MFIARLCIRIPEESTVTCSLYNQLSHPNPTLYLYNRQVDDANESLQEICKSHVWALTQWDQIQNQANRDDGYYKVLTFLKSYLPQLQSARHGLWKSSEYGEQLGLTHLYADLIPQDSHLVKLSISTFTSDGVRFSCKGQKTQNNYGLNKAEICLFQHSNSAPGNPWDPG